MKGFRESLISAAGVLLDGLFRAATTQAGGAGFDHRVNLEGRRKRSGGGGARHSRCGRRRHLTAHNSRHVDAAEFG